MQIRVGVLPQGSTGTLGYQLAFYPGGLINEYAGPSEIIEDGVVTTIDPLTRFEEIDWVGDGLVLEAFATAGVRNDVSGVCRSHRSSRAQDPALPRPRPDDLIGCGRVGYSGAAAMHSVAPADLLMTGTEPGRHTGSSQVSLCTASAWGY
ncbi:MAG: hypothetical protein GY926_07250 [bacterium]|nr:hypothetical protein [bacterium]